MNEVCEEPCLQEDTKGISFRNLILDNIKRIQKMKLDSCKTDRPENIQLQGCKATNQVFKLPSLQPHRQHQEPAVAIKSFRVPVKKDSDKPAEVSLTI